MRLGVPAMAVAPAILFGACSLLPGQIAAGSYDCRYQWSVSPTEAVTAEVAGSQISFGEITADYGPEPGKGALTGPRYVITGTEPDGSFSLVAWAPDGTAWGTSPGHLDCWPPGARP
jgi:pectin methylesterase-like acyl-CoA thioesterase